VAQWPGVFSGKTTYYFAFPEGENMDGIASFFTEKRVK
jgi:hypothetical protein